MPISLTILDYTNTNPNAVVAITCVNLKLVIAFASEVKLGAHFINAQEIIIIKLALAKIGHPQLPIPFNIDNSTCI